MIDQKTSTWPTCTGDYPCCYCRGEDTACHYPNESRRGSFRRRHDIILDRREQLLGLSNRDHTRTLPFYREIKAGTCSGEIPAELSCAIA